MIRFSTPSRHQMTRSGFGTRRSCRRRRRGKLPLDPYGIRVIKAGEFTSSYSNCIWSENSCTVKEGCCSIVSISVFALKIQFAILYRIQFFFCNFKDFTIFPTSRREPEIPLRSWRIACSLNFELVGLLLAQTFQSFPQRSKSSLASRCICGRCGPSVHI